MKTIRTAIIDDEPLARTRLRSLLKEHEGFEVVAEAGDGASAVETIEKFHPDLVFLDVQMPECTGFEVLEALDPGQRPLVCFVTAYDVYAVKAFDVHALDYLLKPVDRERFAAAVKRVRQSIDRNELDDLNRKLSQLIDSTQKERRFLNRVIIKSSGRVTFLRVQDIDWIEAAGNYVRIHWGQESHLLRETMNALEEKLDPEMFLRIHRSVIVNIDRIKELQPAFHGDYFVILKNNKQLPLSRGYRERIEPFLGRF
jgi:two-component system LytT family response regulator